MARTYWWLLPWLLLMAALIAVGCNPVSDSLGHTQFGEKVSYSKGKTLIFPTFQLQYVGERQVASAAYPRGFRYHDFLVIAASGTQTVSWSSGTGDIGPQPFTVDGQDYWLELQRSDRLGPLAENTLVIWKQE